MPHPKVRTTLSLHLDLACKVGLVVAEYATLERLLFSIYALLAPTGPSESLRTFYALHSLGERKRIVLRAGLPLLKPVYVKALKRILRRFSNAANRRTEVAHCEYRADDTQVMRLELSEKAIRYVPLTDQFFDQTFTQYHDLGTDLVTLLAHISTDLNLKEKGLQVVRVVPRAPELGIPPAAESPQGPPTQSEIDST